MQTSVASFTADGAYDQESVAAAVAERHPDAAIIVPPRATAVPSETAETTPTQRDRHLHSIAEHGRAAWQKASRYTIRARAERLWGRLKEWRAVATRYEELAQSFLGVLCLAATMDWTKPQQSLGKTRVFDVLRR